VDAFDPKERGKQDFIRFGELKKSFSGSSTMLSERLQELEREGLVAKKVHGSVPPKVEYSLTASARELDAIVKELGGWYARWKAGSLAQIGMWLLRKGLVCNCNYIQPLISRLCQRAS
jgi:DNA-binding HxlR family transcriptional regulator